MSHKDQIRDYAEKNSCPIPWKTCRNCVCVCVCVCVFACMWFYAMTLLLDLSYLFTAVYFTSVPFKFIHELIDVQYLTIIA